MNPMRAPAATYTAGERWKHGVQSGFEQGTDTESMLIGIDGRASAMNVYDCSFTEEPLVSRTRRTLAGSVDDYGGD